MTSSAPIDRTMSTFLVLHTPVTSAPKVLAICTANVPTPPAAPLIRDLLPGLNSSLVAQTLQRGEPRNVNGSGLLERHALGFHDDVFLFTGRVLGKGTAESTE